MPRLIEFNVRQMMEGDLQIETDPLVFTEAGVLMRAGAHLNVCVKIANVGRTPALAVDTRMKMIGDLMGQRT